MNELTTVALKCLIMLITTAFTVVIIPYIRQKMGEEKWLRFMEYIEYAVRCAEQIYTPEEWEQKKSYVMHFVINKAEELGLDISEHDIDVLVEGIVNAVKH